MQLQKIGHRFGNGGYLHKSSNKHHPKYYLTESTRAMRDLENIRKEYYVNDD